MPVVMPHRAAALANLLPGHEALETICASLQHFHGANAFWMLSNFNEFHNGLLSRDASDRQHGASCEWGSCFHIIRTYERQ